MLVNTFTSVDESLRDFMKEFKKELNNNKMEDPEFPYYFYSYITTSTKSGDDHQKETTKKNFERNPISLSGRTCLINGILRSVGLDKRILRIYLPMYIIHSLTNCLIDINHADQIEKVDIIGHSGIVPQEANLKRKIIYVEGGHNIFEDNPQRMSDLLNKFVLKK